MIYVTDFPAKSDSDSFDLALANLGDDRILVIPPRRSEFDPDRRHWLIDRAILLPSDITVILRNSTIKLSDRCRDNFFRTANCGLGIEFPEPIKNVHIKGIGHCELQGADHPRSTGDGGKVLKNPCPHYKEDILKYADWLSDDHRQNGIVDFLDEHNYTYGTDAGNPDESQYGDWRNIGVLFANVSDFSVDNLHLTCTHGWGLSFESCTYGKISNITFNANMRSFIDGMWHNRENQDGINLRNGCHHVTITDIGGQTGDDLIALTAWRNTDGVVRPGGSLRTTHVMPNDWTRRDPDIHDVIIRNVTGFSTLCYTIRLLPVNTQIYNVLIDGVIDTPPDGEGNNGGVLMGEQWDEATYGDDDLHNVIVQNVITPRKQAVLVWGKLKDSTIANVRTNDPNYAAVRHVREDPFLNVQFSNCSSPNGRATEHAPAVFEKE